MRVGIEAREGGAVALAIRDAGAGFRTKNASAIVRLMAGAKPGHLGVGLLVAQRVARLHGGTLTFESEPAGAVVRLILRAR